VRIIGGMARGRKLAGLTGKDIRPTSDRTREAIFSMLVSRLGSLEGLQVLDLFAGTGAMSLEALSRGAQRAVLVDKGTQAGRLIPANSKACGFEDRIDFLRSDVLTALPRLRVRGPFGLIFLDPPYAQELAGTCIQAIAEAGLLAERGFLCVEAGVRSDFAERYGDLVRVLHRRYGSAAIHLFTHFDDEDSRP